MKGQIERPSQRAPPSTVSVGAEVTWKVIIKRKLYPGLTGPLQLHTSREVWAEVPFLPSPPPQGSWLGIFRSDAASEGELQRCL